MSVPILFLSAVLTKEVLDGHFPGGMAGFRQTYPGAPEDEHLVRLAAMSWDDLERNLNRLRGLGVPLDGQHAVADMMLGALQACPRIAIEPEDAAPFGDWRARLIA